MHADRPEEAVSTRNELTNVLKEKTKSTGLEATKLASWKQKDGKLFEAFLFYQIAFELHQNGNASM